MAMRPLRDRRPRMAAPPRAPASDDGLDRPPDAGWTALRDFARSVRVWRRLAMEGRLSSPREYVGACLRFADGTSSVVFRETMVLGVPTSAPTLLVIQFRLAVLGSDPLLHAAFRRECVLHTPLFAGFPGFRSKLWADDVQTGVYRGVYQWDGPELARRYAERMVALLAPFSNAGTARYRVVDGPTNLMVINSVLWFDEPVDWDSVREIYRGRVVERFPRFRQRVRTAGPLGGPAWEDDPNFDIDLHLHRLALPAPGDRATLQDVVADLVAQPLDRNRPLWDLYLLEGYGRGSALLARMHHCIADGIALARVMLSLTDGAHGTPEGFRAEAAPAAGRSRPSVAWSAPRGTRGWRRRCIRARG
jgi:hypothetical protein